MKKRAKKTSSTEEQKDEKIAGKGHNRPGGIAVDQLRSFVERYEKLDEEKAAVAQDQRDLLAEAKGNGFDTKILKAIVKLRAASENDRIEYFCMLDTYARALGFSILDLANDAEE